MKFRKFWLILLVLLSIVGSSFAQSDDPDGDGLPNSVDQCDNEAGPRTNNGCPVSSTRPTDVPPADSDGDGTADPLDRCPNEAGDGANGGCPLNSTVTNPVVTPELPLAAPTSGACVVSTQGSTPINIRQYPNLDAEIVGVIAVNEWVEVLAVYDYNNLWYSQNGMGNEEYEPQFPILYDEPNPDYPIWYLVQDSDSAATGWVAAAVVRLGGDCSEFVIANPDPDAAYLKIKLTDILISSFSGGVRVATGDVNGDGLPVFPSENPFIFFPAEPQAAVDYLLELDGVKGESRDAEEDPSQRLIEAPEGCTLLHNSDGTVTPTCDDGNTPPSIIVCVYQQFEAGVYTQVCYEVEIPEGCVVNSSEAGVWHITCEDDGDGVQVTPVGETAPILDIKWDGDTVQVGLLLPAVQKVREAAARMR